MQKEPLLAENPNRYVMFPLQDQDIWKSYKKMMDCFWRAEEIFSPRVDYDSLATHRKYFIKMILANKYKMLEMRFQKLTMHNF